MLEGTDVFHKNFNGIDLLVRHVRRDDVEQLRSLINTISLEQTFITFQGEQMSIEEESRYVEGFIAKAENQKAVKLLAFHDGELIGIADVIAKERAESHVGILGLMVAKEWRNKGIGSLLLKMALEEAQKNITELKIITLGVFGNNPIAKRLYEKMGFKEYGLLSQGIRHKGKLVDHIYMYKSVL